MNTINDIKSAIFDIIRQQEYLEKRKAQYLTELNKLEKEEYETKKQADTINAVKE